MIVARTLLALGIWAGVLPFLGFPRNVKDILFSLSGLGVIYVSFVVYKRTRKEKRNLLENVEKLFDNFSENNFESIEVKEEDKKIKI